MLTCVAVSCTLLCASCFCAFCIKALAACLTLAFALVSVSFALISAYCICAVACALTALFALVSALVRSFLKCKSGNGDNFTNGGVLTDITESKSPTTGRICSTVIRTDNKKLAVLKLGPSYCCIIVNSKVSLVSLTCSSPVTEVSTVVDLNKSAVLVNNKSRTKTVGCECTCVILIECDNGVLRSCISVYFCVVEPFALLNCKRRTVDLNCDCVGDNLNNSYNLFNVSAVSSCKNDLIYTNCVDVKSAVRLNSYFNNCIVISCECTVVILSDKTCKNCSAKVKVEVTKTNNDVVILFDCRSLILICSESLTGISPLKGYYVTECVDNVVSHKSAAVSVKAFACVACLNYDSVSACGDGHILSKVCSYGNVFAVNYDCCALRACCTNGVGSINESAGRTVTTFDNNAVCIDDSSFAVVTEYCKCNGSI